MAKATIKSQSGAVITVEGTQEEVSKILSTYESTSVVGHAKEAIARVKAGKRSEKKREGAADLIVNLREAGFLNKPKSLGEIAEALEEKGYLYPTTTLSGVVLSLVKKRELRRKKVEDKWVYGK
ncbi:MAG: hypothetical protein WAN23_18010 [Candidatus Acidiferrales bacterium]